MVDIFSEVVYKLITTVGIVMDAKKPKPPTTNRHKPFRMVRLAEPLAERLEKIAEKRISTVTEEVRNAVREYIEKHTEEK